MRENRERQYKMYVTDALWAISHHNQQMTVKWSDLDPGFVAPRPANTETAEQIKRRLVRKINGEGAADESI